MNRRRFMRQTSAAALLLGCGSKEQPLTGQPSDRAAPPEPPAKPPSSPGNPDAGGAAAPAAKGGGELDGDFPDWNLGDESASPNTVLMFRGNPTHTFYGTGPIPDQPKLLWRAKLGGFRGVKGDGTVQDWSGTGWTGHPVRWGN